MQNTTGSRTAVATALVAAFLPALDGLVQASWGWDPGVSPALVLAGAVSCGAAAAVTILLAVRLGHRVRAAVAVSALVLALSHGVSGVFAMVFVSVAQGALIAAGILAGSALGRILTSVAGLWLVVPLTVSVLVPYTGASRHGLGVWNTVPGLLQAAAYLVAVVLVGGPVWAAVRRGVRHLRDSAEVR